MYCPNCGGKAGDGRFCPYCGALIGSDAPPSSFYTPSEKPEPPKKSGFCLRCGQKIQGETVCPFCGKPTETLSPRSPYGGGNGRSRGAAYAPSPRPSSAPAPKKTGTVSAAVALLCALVPFVGLLPAVLFGIVALVRGSKSRNGLAVGLGAAALVLSIAFFVLFCFLLTEPDLYPIDGFYYFL